jgi:ribosomal-protein-alanine N-acetyltransferase
MTLTTSRQRPERAVVHLRPVRLVDWPTIHEWARRSDVTQYQQWGPNRAIETREYVVASIAAARELPQTRYVLSVVDAGQVVGLIELTVTDASAGIAEMGYAVHPDVWGRGVATVAGRLAVRFAVDQLGMRVLRATCDTTNVASLRVLEKLGMQLEQTLPHHVWLGSRWRDTHVFSLGAAERASTLTEVQTVTERLVVR